MSKDPRKDALKKEWKLQQRQQLAASIPMSQQDLQHLFDYLDRPDLPCCDHTLRETTKFLRRRSLEVERVVDWLREHGGHCDCEVIANVEDKFHDILDV
jgi:hypothetical protein